MNSVFETLFRIKASTRPYQKCDKGRGKKEWVVSCFVDILTLLPRPDRFHLYLTRKDVVVRTIGDDLNHSAYQPQIGRVNWLKWYEEAHGAVRFLSNWSASYLPFCVVPRSWCSGLFDLSLTCRFTYLLFQWQRSGGSVSCLWIGGVRASERGPAWEVGLQTLQPFYHWLHAPIVFPGVTYPIKLGLMHCPRADGDYSFPTRTDWHVLKILVCIPPGLGFFSIKRIGTPRLNAKRKSE